MRGDRINWIGKKSYGLENLKRKRTHQNDTALDKPKKLKNSYTCMFSAEGFRSVRTDAIKQYLLQNMLPYVCTNPTVDARAKTIVRNNLAPRKPDDAII